MPDLLERHSFGLPSAVRVFSNGIWSRESANHAAPPLSNHAMGEASMAPPAGIVLVHARPPRSFLRLEPRLRASLAVSGAAHLTFLLVAWLAPPPASCFCLQVLDGHATSRWIRASLPPQEPPEEPPPELLWLADPTDAAQEPSATPRAGGAGSKMRRSAPRSTHAQRARRAGSLDAAQRARTAGVLGVLLAGGPPASSPFAAAVAASAPDAAAGALALASDSGPGGLGVGSSGRGSGGGGRGTVGVGAVWRGLAETGYGRAFTARTTARSDTVPVIRPCGGPVWTGSGKRECIAIRGALGADVIRRVVRSHLNEVRFCYERSLVTRPDLEGRVLVRFTVAPDGEVVAASAPESTLSHPPTEQCVLRAVRRWTFPRPDGGAGRVAVQYPFVLQQAGN